MAWIKIISGIVLTIFNVNVWVFAGDHIYPKYFENLFGIYFFIALVIGLSLTHLGIEELMEELRNR